jgi:ribosomal protein S18 acetylase RimI-like enzyme
MAKQIIVRKAKISDVKTLQALNIRLFEHEYELFDKTLRVEWAKSSRLKDYLTKNIRNADCCILVALSEDEIIGFIRGWKLSMKTTWRTEHSRAEIVNLYVQDEFRSQKIGARLIKGFLTWAKKKKIEAVIVDPYVGNKRAIDFYRRNGFKDYTLRLEAILRRK